MNTPLLTLDAGSAAVASNRRQTQRRPAPQFHRNPLAGWHARQIGERPLTKRKLMWGNYAVTWNLQQRHLALLGSTSMMVLCSAEDASRPNGERMDLMCVTAQVIQNPTGTELISYSRIRMAHDMGAIPQIGAFGRTLDPRESDDPTCNPRDRPNADWVRLAMNVDSHRTALAYDTTSLPVVPQMPRILAAVARGQSVEIHKTDALIAFLAEQAKLPVADVESMPDADLAVLAKQHASKVWIEPGTGVNNTPFRLIDLKFLRSLNGVGRLYEDFSELLGLRAKNIVPRISAVGIPNPAVDVLKEFGMLPDESAASSAESSTDATVDAPAAPMTVERQEELLAAVDVAPAMVAAMRTKIGDFATNFSDAQIADFLDNPAEPIAIAVTAERPLRTIVDKPTAIAIVRNKLNAERPQLSNDMTDDDIWNAIENPNVPMVASRAAAVQVLFRNPEMPLAESLTANGAALGRPELCMELWVGDDWRPPTLAPAADQKVV